MIKKDFLMRLIREAIQGLHEVMGFRNAGKIKEARDKIGDTMETVVGLEPKAVAKLHHQQLLDILQLHHSEEWRERATLLANLVEVQAQLHEDEEQEETGYVHRLKALHLLLAAGSLEEDFFLPEFAISPDELIQTLTDEFILPVETYQAILLYYELSNQLDSADNLLFEWAEVDGNAIETAVSFYDRLLSKPDEQLEDGNLPRHEVESSLQEMQSF